MPTEPTAACTRATGARPTAKAATGPATKSAPASTHTGTATRAAPGTTTAPATGTRKDALDSALRLAPGHLLFAAALQRVARLATLFAQLAEPFTAFFVFSFGHNCPFASTSRPNRISD